MSRRATPLNIPPGEKLTPELAFALVLREKRTALGLTQADLEGDGSIDHAYISKIELAKRQICLRGIIHLARKLKMEPEELLAEVIHRMKTYNADK